MAGPMDGDDQGLPAREEEEGFPAREEEEGLLSLLTPGAPVLVAGAGVTGRAVLTALAPLGVAATLCDDRPEALQVYAEQGTAVTDPAGAIAGIADYALVVTSPGFPPTAAVLAAAA